MMHLPHTDKHINKRFSIFGFAVLCAILSAVVFHPKQHSPLATFADCRTTEDCREALDADMPAAASRDGISLPEASEECRNLQAESLAICSTEYENRSSDEGDWTYARRDHIKDIAICRRVSTAVLHACTTYEKDHQ